jgi:hypothetical protein
MTTTADTRVLTFSVLVEKTEGVFVANCLETGLVAVANEQSDVLSAMEKLLQRLILFALENDRLGDIYHKAPHEVWSQWMTIEERMIKQTRSRLPKSTGTKLRPPVMIEQTAYASYC